MKQTSTQVRVPFRMCLVLSLLSISMMFGKTSSAHNVLYFNPPCFTQGTNVTIPVWIANAVAGTFYHWQYRVPGGSWTYLSNGNNTINGRTFSVANAAINVTVSNNSTSTGALLNPTIAISNVGSPAYTTQLDNVEFRVLMTDALDPQTNAVNTWGGEEFLNPYEAKYVRLISKPATDNCYSNCTGNALVANPAAVPPPIEDYFGGFESSGNPVSASATNFATPAANGTTKANSDITLWTTSPLSTSARYRFVNTPDTMNTAFAGFAPHGGREMMVISRLQSTTTRVWYRTIVVPSASQFFNGQITIKAWFAKVDATTDPGVVFEVKGSTTTSGGTFAVVSGGTSSTTSVTGTAGTWVQKTFTLTLPTLSQKRLEISIRSTNASAGTPVSFALDDICLLEPSAAVLPVSLTGLKGTYSGGVAHLTWGTQQEYNSNYFEIERSTDGANFSSLGKVAAAGNSTQTLNYKFDDIKANAGNNYYRLKMVDKDGSFEYSNIVMINVSIKGLNVTGIYPTPFTDKVNISVSSEMATDATIRILDNTGKVMAKQQSAIHKGITTITMDNLGQLAKGFYIIEVQSGETKVTQKLMK